MELNTILETTEICINRLYDQFLGREPLITNIIIVKNIIKELQDIKSNDPYPQFINIIDTQMPNIKKCISFLRQYKQDYIYWKINIFIKQLIYLLNYCGHKSNYTLKFQKFQDEIISIYSLVNKYYI